MLFKGGGDLGDTVGIVVWSLAAAAEDEVGGGVASGGDDGGDALFGHGEEVVWAAGGADGVEGDLDRAAGAIFESDGHGEPGGEFAVNL